MDNLNDKLSSILSDPDALNRLQDMARSIFSAEEPPKPEPTPDSGGLIPADIDLGAVSRLMGLMNNNKDDSRVQLLLALKPNLSPEKQKRVDSAIKILKLIELMPLIRETGLFEF